MKNMEQPMPFRLTLKSTLALSLLAGALLPLILSGMVWLWFFSDTLETEITFFWGSSLLIALIVLAVAWYFLRKAIAPLSRLELITQNISMEHYRFSLPPTPYVEINRISATFDAMMAALIERERALQQREKHLRDLYDSVSDLIYTQDLEGRFLTLNNAMATLFGYKPEEMIGRRAADSMKPEMRAHFEIEYLAALKENGRYQGTSAYFTKTRRKIYIEYASVLVRPEKGEAFISGIGRDVTERILAEREIRERENRIQAILEAVPIPLVVYDQNGIPMFFNPAFTSVFGWTLEELKGKKIPFVPEDQMDRTVARIKALYSGESLGTLETGRLTKDGRILDVLINAALIKGKVGLPTGMVVSLMDLTKKKQLEAGLMQAQKMEAIGTLAGGVAHDFNNLLMAIQGGTALMLMDMDKDHPLYSQLKEIERHARQGASLTRQLLGFAKGGKYEVKPTDLNDLIRSHNRVFGRTRKEIRIHERFQKDLWPVAADRGQMEQMLLNLTINASDAMPESGDIFVTTRNVAVEDEPGRPFEVTPGKYVRLSVVDNGKGMDAKVRERIFEPFFTTKPMGRGTGLGLASVYGIVKNHHGFIEVKSEIGNGTEFHIFLPAVEGRAVDIETEPEPRETAVKGEGTILMVDDEEIVRKVGRHMLERIGFRVHVAEGAREALDLYEKHGTAIDLVVLDMIMPEMGGKEAFGRLVSMDPHVKVLLSSGYSLDGQAQAILDMGCRGFIQKPFSIEELSRKVGEILEAK